MHRHHAFTLVELLVVIAIIALLAALLLPMAGKAMECARRVQCQSNMRQIMMAVHMYVDDNHGWMPLPWPQGINKSVNPCPSAAIWMTSYGQLDYTRGALWPYVAPTPATRRRIFNCPSDPDPKMASAPPKGEPVPGLLANFSYVFNQWLVEPNDPDPTKGGDLWAQQRLQNGYVGIKLSQIVHPSHKVVLYEEPYPESINNDPTGVAVDPGIYTSSSEHGTHIPPRATRHSGGSNLGMADGHVEWFGPQGADLGGPYWVYLRDPTEFHP